MIMNWIMLVIAFILGAIVMFMLICIGYAAKQEEPVNKSNFQAMTQSEHTRLVAQIAVLKEVAEEYPGKTIDNIIAQMEAIKKEIGNNAEKQ